MPDVTAIDMSKWGGDFTLAEAQCCLANGCTTVILATGPGGYSANVQIQADDAVAAGLSIEVYWFLEWGSDPAWWIREGWAKLGDWAQYVKRGWVDIEDVNNPAPATLDERIAYVQAGLDEADKLGIPIGIYTGGWYWRDSVRGMANTAVFGDRALWNSYYDQNPNISGLPYGGWTQESVAIEQFAGTSDFCGQSVDLNHVYIPAGDADVTPDEVRAIVREMLATAPPDLDIDKRLREVMVKRMTAVQSARTIKAIRAAFDPDHVPGE